jgi:hypothetical protein
MDRATVDRLVEWAERQYADREWVQKDEVLADARNADLPTEAKRSLKELPQVRVRRDEMLELIRTIDQPWTRQQVDMDQPPDGVPRGGHEGEPEE